MDHIQTEATRIYTARAHASADAMARRFTADAVHFRRDEVVRFLAAGMAFIHAGKFSDIPSDYLDDFARGLSDAVSNAVGGMRKDLDNAGLDPDAANVDVVELDALIGGRVL